MRISILRCLEASDQKIRSLTYIKIKFYLMGHVFKAETLEKFKPHIWLQLQQKMSSGLRTKIILRLSPAVRTLVSSEDEYWNNYELDRRLIAFLRWFFSSGGEVTEKNKLEILWECTLYSSAVFSLWNIHWNKSNLVGPNPWLICLYTDAFNHRWRSSKFVAFSNEYLELIFLNVFILKICFL